MVSIGYGGNSLTGRGNFHPAEGLGQVMPLLNYTTKISAEKTASEIISLLSRKGATQVMMEFGATGQPVGLKWRVNSPRGALGFALPINTEAVYKVLTAERILVTNDQARREQALRTAWRIVKEWVAAQMALIETGMVEMEEVFLPYMLSGDRTVYQVLSEDNFRALGSAEGPR